jgi:hypothetical protein
MAAHPITRQAQLASKETQQLKSSTVTNSNAEDRAVVADEHLPPILFTFCILTCSSILFILCLRDFWMTGKNLYGVYDESYLVRHICNIFIIFIFI